MTVKELKLLIETLEPTSIGIIETFDPTVDLSIGALGTGEYEDGNILALRIHYAENDSSPVTTMKALNIDVFNKALSTADDEADVIAAFECKDDDGADGIELHRINSYIFAENALILPVTFKKLNTDLNIPLELLPDLLVKLTDASKVHNLTDLYSKVLGFERITTQ